MCFRAKHTCCHSITRFAVQPAGHWNQHHLVLLVVPLGSRSYTTRLAVVLPRHVQWAPMGKMARLPTGITETKVLYLSSLVLGQKSPPDLPGHVTGLWRSIQ